MDHNRVSVNQRQMPASNDFKKVKLISQGAYGKVYLVKRVHERSGVEYYYALKSMEKQLLKEKNVLYRVLEERQALSTIDGRFVVRIYFSFLMENTIDLVMEYVEGGDMASLLIRHRQETNEPGLPEAHARFYIAEALLALAYLHERGITHRDVKPDNMLIDRNGHLKLTDFGFARIPADYRNRSPTALVPSPNTGENKSRSPAARNSLKQALTSPEQFEPCIISASFASDVCPNRNGSIAGDMQDVPMTQPVVAASGKLQVSPAVTLMRSSDLLAIKSDDECEVQSRIKSNSRGSRPTSSCSSTLSTCTSIAGNCSTAALERPIQQLARLKVHDSTSLIPADLSRAVTGHKEQVKAVVDSPQHESHLAPAVRFNIGEPSPVASASTSTFTACIKRMPKKPLNEDNCTDRTANARLSTLPLCTDRENVCPRAANDAKELLATRKPLGHSNRAHTLVALHSQTKPGTRRCGLANHVPLLPVTPTGNGKPRPSRKRSVQERAENRTARRDSTKQKRMSTSRFDDCALMCASGGTRARPLLNRALSLNLMTNEQRLERLHIDIDLNENDTQPSFRDSVCRLQLFDDNARSQFDDFVEVTSIECARSSRQSRSSIDASTTSLWVDSQSNSLTTQSDAPLSDLKMSASHSASSPVGSANSLLVNVCSDSDSRSLAATSFDTVHNLPALLNLSQPLNPEFVKLRSSTSQAHFSLSTLENEQEQPRRDAVRITDTSSWVVSSSPLTHLRGHKHSDETFSHRDTSAQLNSTAYTTWHNPLKAHAHVALSPLGGDGFLHEPACLSALAPTSPDTSNNAPRANVEQSQCDMQIVMSNEADLVSNGNPNGAFLNASTNHTLDVTPPTAGIKDSPVRDANVSVTSDADSTMTRCSDHSRCLGTLPYMAPELWDARPPRVSELPRVDVWALGVCLYEFVFGILPFGCFHSTTSSTHDEYGEIIEQIKNIEMLDLESHSNLFEVIVSEACINAIRCLLRRSPTDRPTAAQFREHEFFCAHIDFERIHEVEAPWKPPINSRLDTQLFRENLERRGCVAAVEHDV